MLLRARLQRIGVTLQEKSLGTKRTGRVKGASIADRAKCSGDDNLARSGQPSYDDICEKVVRRLRRELQDDLLAVLLTGSIEDGSCDEGSDVDVCVIWKRGHSQRRRIIVENVEVDLFCDNPDGAKRMIARANRRFFVWMYAHASMLFDPLGIGAELMKQGAAVWARGRSSPTKSETFQGYCEVRDGLRTIERVDASDSVNFEYLVGAYVQTLVEVYWSRRGLWGTHRKSALRDIRQVEPEAYSLIATILDRNCDIDARKATVRRLAKLTLGGDFEIKEIEGAPFRR
jgi:predicted nucleotidyltransferase